MDDLAPLLFQSRNSVFRGGSESDGAAVEKPWNSHCSSRGKSKAGMYFPLKEWKTPSFLTKLKTSLHIYVLEQQNRFLLKSQTSETSKSHSTERHC